CVAGITTSFLLAISLSAQEVAPSSPVIQLPKWDVDASIGAFIMSQQAIDNEQRAANPDGSPPLTGRRRPTALMLAAIGLRISSSGLGSSSGVITTPLTWSPLRSRG